MRAAAYDMPGFIVDGNDVMEVFRFASEAVARPAQAKVPRCSNAKPIDGRVTSSASRRSLARARIVRLRKSRNGNASAQSSASNNFWSVAERFQGRSSIGSKPKPRPNSDAIKFARESELPDASEVTDDVFAE